MRRLPLWAAFAVDYPADPRSARAAFWAGQAHAAAGRPGAALAELESYIPRAGRGRNVARAAGRRRCAIQAGRLSAARGLLKAVLTARADPAGPHGRLGAAGEP